MEEEVYYHQHGVWLTERWIHYGDTTRAVESIVSIEMCVREPKDRAVRVLLGVVLLGFLFVFTPMLGFLSLGAFSLWIRYMDSESPREYFVLLGFEGGHREYIPVPFAKAREVIELKKAINRAWGEIICPRPVSAPSAAWRTGRTTGWLCRPWSARWSSSRRSRRGTRTGWSGTERRHLPWTGGCR